MSRPDKAEQVAFDFYAPQDERTDALAGLQKAHAPTSLSDLLLPPDDMREAIDYIEGMWQEQQFNKSLHASNVIPFPSEFAREGKRGMQSVNLDYLQITAMGDYWEKPGRFSFDTLRQMVAQTPVLNAVIMTRVRQAQRFCRVNESGQGPGFTIAHIDRGHEMTESEQESVRLLNRFMANCGWEFNPRARRRLRRESFSQFMAKLVRDSLTLDSAPIETELARDRSLGIDGLYAVDGATIRLCTEDGYQGDDEIFALQVVQGRISSGYTYDELIYEPRNPQSDVLTSGYGLAESELMVRVVTGFLNAMTYNIKGFDSNAIPKGVLQLTGNYNDRDIAAFKRIWNAMVRGVQNAWSLPVMVSKDLESKASFEKFGIEFNEMYFSKWMTFLTSIICAIYGMSPAEINFDSFTAGNTSALSGSDTDEKIAASRDSGLWPLLSYFEGVFTDYVVSDFSDKYVFRWTGIDQDDVAKREERARLVLTVNEMRAQERLPPIEGDFGDAPLNQALTGIWMQLNQQQKPQDFGQPPGQGGPGGDGQEQGEDDQEGGPSVDENGPQGQQRQGFDRGPKSGQDGGGNDPQPLRGGGGGGGGRGDTPFGKAHVPAHTRMVNGKAVPVSAYDTRRTAARHGDVPAKLRGTTITGVQGAGGGGSLADSPLVLAGDAAAPLSASAEQLRADTIKWAKRRWSQNSGGRLEVVRCSDPAFAKDVLIGWQGVKHAISNANQPELRLIPRIPDILRSAKYLRGEDDKSARAHIKKAHKLRAEVLLDGERLFVGVVVHEKDDGQLFYDQFLIGAPQKDAPPHGTSGNGMPGISDRSVLQPSSGGAAIVPPSGAPGNDKGTLAKAHAGDEILSAGSVQLTKAIGMPPVLRIQLPEVFA